MSEDLLEPVWYCARCHSLAIKRDETLACGGWDGSWCCRCGGTDVRECTFGEWLEAEGCDAGRG